MTPSSELRKWFHAGGSPEEFRVRYEAELAAPGALEGLDRLRELAAAGPLTLVTAVKDPDHSHASVLAELLEPGT